jgi:alpha-tubulin suppressor-like RCC1 family protein
MRWRALLGMACSCVLLLAVLPLPVWARSAPRTHRAKDTTLRIVVRSLPGRLSAKIIVTGPHHVHKRVTRSVTLRLHAGVYLVSAASVRGSAGSYYATAPRSRVVLRAGKATGFTVVYATLVPKSTMVVPAGATSSLTGDPAGPRVLTITGSAARAVRVGDSLSSGVTSAAPYGYLVKVTKVAHKSGSSATLEVENTTLLAALPTGEIDSTETIEAPASAALLVRLIPSEGSLDAGSSARSARTQAPRAHTAGFSLQTTNLSCTTSAGVHVEDPTVTFTPSISLQAKWGFLKVESATFTATVTEAIALGVDAEAGAKCETNDPGIGLLPQPITLPDVDVQVGPVPVIISPTLQLYLSGSAGITAKASAALTQTASATVGANYSHGTITPISSVSNNFTPAFSAEGDASAEVALTPTVDTKIYDVAGPSFDVGVAAKFDANTSKNPWWTLQGCLQGGVGFVVELLDIDWSDPHLLSLCKTLLSASGSHPGGAGGGTGSPGPPGGSNPTAPGGGDGGVRATAIVAGTYHSCALLSTGGLDCWGANFFGQLGNGTTTSSSIPVEVDGIANAIQIAAASDSCALLSTGGVNCWGYNPDGELGDGMSTGPENCEPSACSTMPVEVSGLTTATQVAAGQDHTCALLSTGGIDCWGSNAQGQLGNGTTTDSSTPVPVSGIINATQIATGGLSSCALLSTGGIDCWGYNQNGELGDGNAINSPTPVPVSGITNATQLATGADCALLSTGGIDCWGYNGVGELGDGSTTDSYTPVAVSGITNATQVASNNNNSCATLSTGGIDCWGYNHDGQLGDGTTTESSIPVAVSGIADASAVAVGDLHSCALLSTGGIDCWGDNEFGALGNGTTEAGLIPVPVSGLP